MSDNKHQDISSIMDNELLDAQPFDDLINNSEQQETWQRYHLMGDAIRGELPHELHLDLSSNIAAAIAEEPTVLAPVAKPSAGKKLKAKIVTFAKPFGQLAIAASAAGLVIINVQQANIAENNAVVPSQTVQTNPLAGIAAPVSYNYGNAQADKEQIVVDKHRRFQGLLSDHQQQVKLNSQHKAEDKINQDDVNETTP